LSVEDFKHLRDMGKDMLGDGLTISE